MRFEHRVFVIHLAIPVVAWLTGMATAASIALGLLALATPAIVGLGLVARRVFQRRGQGRAPPAAPLVVGTASAMVIAWICAFLAGRLWMLTGEPQPVLLAEALVTMLVISLVRVRQRR